jgi:hypothetical protein
VIKLRSQDDCSANWQEGQQHVRIVQAELKLPPYRFGRLMRSVRRAMVSTDQTQGCVQ